MRAGDRLGNYEIVGQLGAGGMGEVYRAHDLLLRRDVAVKVLSPRIAADGESLQRFEREARAMAAFTHPNIAVLYGFERAEWGWFLAMELVEGESLDRRLARGAVPRNEALRIARQIAAALEAAHQRGIVHRDLKPSNVMLTRAGDVKLLDFGLSSVPIGPASPDDATTPGDPVLTRVGTLLGTAPYMSPEQLLGTNVDSRSDLWSFGCVLYEMLTGRRPFGGDSLAAMTVAIATQDPDWSRLPADLPRAVSAVVQQCLRKERDGRPSSIVGVRAALGEAEAPRAVNTGGRRVYAGALAVVAVLVLAALIGVWRMKAGERGGTPPGRPAIRSIVVLPFASDSPDAAQAYFADGMTDALINDLSALGLWRVISRTSAMHYRSSGATLGVIARELDVDAVVEGAVLRDGDRVRITARLIHAATEQGLRSWNFERELKDILHLQRELASAIASQLKGKLAPEAQARLSPGSEVDPETHLLYLQGRFHWNERTPASLDEAIRHFERALKKDPNHAPSHVGLAETYQLLSAQGIGVLSPGETFPLTKQAATRALALDDSLAGAHAALGYTALLWDWDWEASEREFKKALDLNPGYANARFWYAAALASRGRFEDAREQARTALEFDPVSPIVRAGLAWVHHLAGEHDAVIDVGRRALELNPSFPILHHRIALAYGQRGLHRDAIKHHRRAVETSGQSPDMIAYLAYGLATGDQRDEARRTLRTLDERRKTHYVSAFSMAVAHLGLGHREAAFEWLEKAVQERSWYLPFAAVDPILNPLRADPRFVRLLQQTGAAAPRP